jgi:hypothetical protein
MFSSIGLNEKFLGCETISAMLVDDTSGSLKNVKVIKNRSCIKNKNGEKSNISLRFYYFLK